MPNLGRSHEQTFNEALARRLRHSSVVWQENHESMLVERTGLFAWQPARRYFDLGWYEPSSRDRGFLHRKRCGHGCPQTRSVRPSDRHW